jgi:eukaryotic-like serine/threonine-protein kinase
VAYLVMAFVDGEPLSSRIAAAGALTVGETMSVVAQAGDALPAVHGVVDAHDERPPGAAGSGG